MLHALPIPISCSPHFPWTDHFNIPKVMGRECLQGGYPSLVQFQCIVAAISATEYETSSSHQEKRKLCRGQSIPTWMSQLRHSSPLMPGIHTEPATSTRYVTTSTNQTRTPPPPPMLSNQDQCVKQLTGYTRSRILLEKPIVQLGTTFHEFYGARVYIETAIDISFSS
jgi:hypothetical protein